MLALPLADARASLRIEPAPVYGGAQDHAKALEAQMYAQPA